jgi:alpha-L-fucosidase 2
MKKIQIKEQINPHPTHGMHNLQPATRWEDAYPSGNGPVGALVFGNIYEELIILNHEALWFQRKKKDTPNISETVPELREMLKNGEWSFADRFFAIMLAEKGYATSETDPYHPAFDISIKYDPQAPFQNYTRCLDFESGKASVFWQEKSKNQPSNDPIQFQRDCFVSRVDDVVCVRFKCDDRGFDANINLIQHPFKPGEQFPVQFESKTEGSWISIVGSYPKNSTIKLRGEPGELVDLEAFGKANEFGGLARIINKDGTVNSQNGIQAQNTHEVLILVKLFVHEKSAIAIPRLKKELSALPSDYITLQSRHQKIHQALFDRMTLNLHGNGSEIDNEHILLSAYNGNVPTALIERMFEFGRYLLISSCREGSWPPNLQGKWNGEYNPAWSSDYHNDENIQMNYWAALPGNLPETTLPYFDFYEACLPDYRKNAQAIYGARGIFAPIAQAVKGEGPIYGGIWLNWTGGAGWLAQIFYDYWLYTNDDDFLSKRAIPFLKEVALFYEDFMIEDEKGKYQFVPSLSPENVPLIPGGSLVTINATMDVAIAKEILFSLSTACKHLGIEKENVTKWQKMLKKMPEYEVNEDGAIREWIYPGLKDNYQHRHIAHIYPLFPGFEITEESDPKIFKACRVAVDKRMMVGQTSQTGWSMAHQASISARLNDGNRALECLELLTRSTVGTNLFTYHNDWRSQGLTVSWFGVHPPFQIDANFGFTAAVLEMLVFSAPGLIKILPALPSKWSKGSAHGILCRGGIIVSIDWDLPKKTLRIEIETKKTQHFTLKSPLPICSFTVESGQDPEKSVFKSPLGDNYKVISLEKDQKLLVTLQIK